MGYEIFALAIASCYLIMSFVVLTLHIKEAQCSNRTKVVIRHAHHFAITVGLMTLIAVAMFGYNLFQNIFTIQGGAFAFVDPKSIIVEGVTQSTTTDKIFSEYKVQEGDTLRSVSQKYFGTDADWKYIKRQKAGNPDLIFAGETVSVPSAI